MDKAKKWLIEFIVIIAVFLIIRTFFVQAFNIPSGSMKPTLLVGDFILVNKLVYRFTEPRRGDIVVFKWPLNPKIDFIKRIIGMPGDTIEIRGHRVFINGKELPLKLVGKDKDGEYERLIYEETLPNGVKHLIALYKNPPVPRVNLPPTKIPENAYFVMGDNRDNSEDSRYWGFLYRDNIVGKAFVIYFSGKVPPIRTTDVTPFTAFRQIFYAILNPRFDRIGKHFIW